MIVLKVLYPLHNRSLYNVHIDFVQYFTAFYVCVCENITTYLTSRFHTQESPKKII